MSLPKPIPKRWFQAYALVLLAVAWIGALVLATSDLPPVAMLVSLVGRPLGAFLLWVAASLVWMALAIPVRLFTSGFDTLEQSLAKSGARSLPEAIALEQARLERARTGPPSERRRADVLRAAAGIVLTFAFGMGLLVNLSLFPDRFFLIFPVGALVSALLALFHGARALDGKLRE